MARITVEDCLEQMGDGNRFNLIHLTLERIKQHRRGEPFLVQGDNKEIVMTLREISAAKVTVQNIKSLSDRSGKGKNVVQEEIVIEQETVA